MHIVALNAKGADVFRVPVGQYLMDDANTGECLTMGFADNAAHYPTSPAPQGSTQLLVRAGGFGDLLMLTPVLHALQSKHATSKIGVATMSLFASLIPEGFTSVPYPIPFAELSKWESIVSLENVIESMPDTHAVDALAHALIMESPLDKKPTLILTTEERERAALRFPKTAGEKRIGIQVRASAQCRTWPQENLEQFGRLALDAGYRLFIFGAPGSWISTKKDDPRVVNLTKAPALSFRDSAAVFATCDVALTPDSSLCHVAGALGVPTIALYGPVPWQNRTSDYPTVHAIQGHCRVSPCNHHVRGGQEFPPHGPCALTGVCTAMSSIPADRTFNLVQKLFKKHQDSK